MFEHTFFCPFCNASISMILDFSIPKQSYIEDCEVCCRPLQIDYTSFNNELTFFQAIAVSQ